MKYLSPHLSKILLTILACLMAITFIPSSSAQDKSSSKFSSIKKVHLVLREEYGPEAKKTNVSRYKYISKCLRTMGFTVSKDKTKPLLEVYIRTNPVLVNYTDGPSWLAGDTFATVNFYVSENQKLHGRYQEKREAGIIKGPGRVSYKQSPIWNMATDTACGAILDAVAEVGEPAVPYIAKTVKSKRHVLRLATIHALVKTRSELAVRPLIESIMLEVKRQGEKSNSAIIFNTAFKGLERLGEPAAIAINDLLVKQKLYYRPKVAAIKTLGAINSKVAIPGLLQTLKDRDENVRKLSAEILDQLAYVVPAKGPDRLYYFYAKQNLQQLANQGKKGQHTLVQLLMFNNAEIAERIRAQLIKIGQPVVPFLIASLHDYRITESAAMVLGEIKDESAVQPLIDILKKITKAYPNSKHPNVLSVTREIQVAIQKIVAKPNPPKVGAHWSAWKKWSNGIMHK